ncbi:MAG: c-type cytochrome domain-containing protein [Verrucomicrobiota bacterium]
MINARDLLFMLACVLLCSASLGQDPAYSFDAEDAAQAVAKIFERSCAECHDGASRSRSKGRFGTVMDFDAMREDPDLLIPGDAEESELYLLIIDPDPEYVMPPPESDCPQLTEIEANLVKYWINEGAPTPQIGLETQIPKIVEPEEVALSSKWMKAFGKLHVLVIHFPIALIWVAFFASISEKLKWPSNPQIVISWCLLFGGVIAGFSVATGWIQSDVSGYSDDSVFNHRWSGVAVAVSGNCAWLFHQLRRSAGSRLFETLFWICLLVSVIAVSMAGHTGGKLVYGDETFFDLLR